MSSKPFRSNLVAMAATAVFAFAPPVSLASGGGDPQLPGEALVQLTSPAALAPLLTKYRFSLVGQFGARPIYRLKIVGNADLDAALRGLAGEPAVLAAEPNAVHSSPEARKNAVWAIGRPDQYTVQWAPQAMNLAAAQQLTRGAGVRVAVLDTGVDRSHPALAGHLLPGYDFVDGDTDPAEGGGPADAGFGHGTHVAGLVALAAPDAKIIPMRVLDARGQGNVWVLAEALLRAIDPDGNPATDDGAHVVNISLGTLERTRIVDTVLKLATCTLPAAGTPGDDYADPSYGGDRDRCTKTRGVVIVAAAGNGASRSEQQYPAAEGEDGLMPVAASAPASRLADFSNSGSWIRVAAPGDRVTSALPNGAFGTWSGTSMAAPLAAGAAALVRAAFPMMPAKDIVRRLEDHGRALCNGASQRQIDVLAALRGIKPAAPVCD